MRHQLYGTLVKPTKVTGSSHMAEEAVVQSKPYIQGSDSLANCAMLFCFLG